DISEILSTSPSSPAAAATARIQRFVAQDLLIAARGQWSCNSTGGATGKFSSRTLPRAEGPLLSWASMPADLVHPLLDPATPRPPARRGAPACGGHGDGGARAARPRARELHRRPDHRPHRRRRRGARIPARLGARDHRRHALLRAADGLHAVAPWRARRRAADARGDAAAHAGPAVARAALEGTPR